MSAESATIVIASAARTPVGSFNGALASLPAHELGKTAIQGALDRAGVAPGDVSEVIMGQILAAGAGQNPARQASIAAGIPVDAPAWGMNQLCGSGLRAVALGAQQIQSGSSQIVIAGGQESMSQAPHCLHLRDGTKMGDAKFIDTMIKDGLWDAFNGYHMGTTAENVARQWQITREEQDRFAVASQNKAEAAKKAGKFKDEIAPVSIMTRKGETVVADDEYIKEGVTFESIAKLRPAFEKEGTVTAANASGINDGAAAVALMSLAEAKRRGIVRIEVVPPTEVATGGLADRLTRALSLATVYLSHPLPNPGPGRTTVDVMGGALAPAVGKALSAAGLLAGDVLLVSSGRTVYEVAQYELVPLPGVLVAPTVGGNDQPEEWYQTNEITRLVANRLGGRPNYLFAPALPGEDLYPSLLNDPSIQRVLHLWPHARCVLMGIGAPPLMRSDIPRFVPTESSSLRSAVGDVCSRFFDRRGEEVEFDGRDRLIAVELEALRHIPVTIAVAVGKDKIESIIAGARGGYFNQLVTDPSTAAAILESLDGADATSAKGVQ